MPKTAKSELFAEFLESFGGLWKILEAQTLRVNERKMISEAAIFLHEMLKRVGLDKTEEEFAHSWLRQLGYVLGREFEGNFILLFHYFDQNYRKGPGKTTETMISLVLALRALETCGLKLPRTGTVWKYLERDMPRFRKALKRILDKNKAESRVNELFLLLNTIDMLATIKDSKKLTHEFEEFIELVSEYQRSFDKASKVSPGLVVYVADLANRLNLPIQVNKLPSKMSGKPAAFSALMKLRIGKTLAPRQLECAHHPPALHLWWIAKAWAQRQSEKGLVGILPFYRHIIDIDTIFHLVWGDSGALLKIRVSNEEIERVLKFTDREIKQQLYQYFQKHPNVTEYSRARLLAERDKVHGGGEISDFNVEFFAGKEKIWAAIPIKSGRETRTQNRSKIEQNFFYQFIRPFLSFGTNRTVVFPIILVKFKLNASEFLSQMRAHLQLPILVLDIKTYTQFLKRERLLFS